jgi:hypothetical protein
MFWRPSARFLKSLEHLLTLAYLSDTDRDPEICRLIYKGGSTFSDSEMLSIAYTIVVTILIVK